MGQAILPAAAVEFNGQTTPAQIGFSRGGEVDRPQFALVLRAVGWTTTCEFANWAKRSGVVFEGTPLRVRKSSSCERAGWPWRLPARAPTDPYVRTLAHTVPLMMDSPYS